MTPTNAYQRLVDALHKHGCRVDEKSGGRAAAQAPGHSDTDRSVSILHLPGRVLINSHSDPTSDVLDALGLTLADLYDNRSGVNYRYGGGRIVHRDPFKKFRQSGDTKDTSLFHAEGLPAETTLPVYFVEGENDVLAVETTGYPAVCAAQGAGKAHLADLEPLRGRPVIVVADKDGPGRRHAQQVVELLAGVAESTVIVEAKTGKDAADHILAGHDLSELVVVAEQATGPSLVSVRLSDVEPERITWLWPGRMPAGKLVTLDGDPSLGKSTLALTFAATITNCGTWPDNTTCTTSGDVILLSGEDGLADTVRPRLDAAGADVTRVHAVQGIALEDGTLVPPTLGDVRQLEQLIRQTAARLLIVDVLMAYLPGKVDSHKDQDIRRVLSALATMADETGCTVLLLRHLNKAKGGDPLYRGGGSIGIVGAARAGMLVAADPDDETGKVRVLASTKSNLGPAPESLRYQLVSAEGTDVARVDWLGVDGRDARELLSEPTFDDGDDRSSIIRIVTTYLTECGGSAPAADVLKHTRSAGLTDNAVKKARSKRGSGIRTEKSGFGKGASWFWSIDSPIGSEDSRDSETGTNGINVESMECRACGLPLTGPDGRVRWSV
ncbi:hypothetical protein nbrc107696_15700 [Gordonia spumicola]|uniref:Toprim domain-containing protein n=1 Tax=Gordonia spumicola TaxID=589161 RepID=A0A7I9V7B1_9ACTN|nr:AAA family ATPase [Gordonia spumicola]GEE01124.1 hypothetical protein nbrc107696_15700 [Gordonia spumicola]